MHHPGILNSSRELEYIKAQVKAGRQPWRQAFDALKSSRYSSLDYGAHPFEEVSCGSYNKPNIGCNEMVEDGMAAYSQSLLWYLTDDHRYADNAIAILTAWSSKYQRNTKSNSRLVVSWAVPWYVNAAELLRSGKSGWSEAGIQSFTRMLTDKLLPYTLDDTMPGNNWVQSAIEAHMAIAIFTDDRPLFDRAVSRWRFRVKTYIYQTSDGPLPISSPGKTPAETVAIWRSASPGTVYVDGLGMETCRDLGHLMLGFKSMMYAAESAWQQGVDVFAPEQKRIADFLELHSRWILGEAAVPASIAGGRLLINPREPLPPTGGPGQALEIAYNHISTRLKRPLPATLRMRDKSRPSSAGRWVAKWETLTHGDLPFF